MYHCNMSPAVNQTKIKLDVKLIGMILLFCKSSPSWMTLSYAAVVTRQYIFPIFDWFVIRWLRLCWNIPFIHCFSASSVYHFYKYFDLYLEFLGEVVLICVVEISISCHFRVSIHVYFKCIYFTPSICDLCNSTLQRWITC